jgi:anti-anti-sigma factor
MTWESCYTIPVDVPSGTFEVHLRGEIDLICLPQLHQIVAAFARSMAGNVVIDLARVTFFDVTGVGLLVDLHREASIRGCRFSLRNIPPMTRRIIQVAGLAHLLPSGKHAPDPRFDGLVGPGPAPDTS